MTYQKKLYKKQPERKLLQEGKFLSWQMKRNIDKIKEMVLND